MLHGLEVATHCVEDMDEWLGMFNVKLRHMREDIESVGTSTFLEYNLHIAVQYVAFIEVSFAIMCLINKVQHNCR